jgi:hypothetical protein
MNFVSLSCILERRVILLILVPPTRNTCVLVVEKQTPTMSSATPSSAAPLGPPSSQRYQRLKDGLDDTVQHLENSESSSQDVDEDNEHNSLVHNDTHSIFRSSSSIGTSSSSPQRPYSDQALTHVAHSQSHESLTVQTLPATIAANTTITTTLSTPNNSFDLDSSRTAGAEWNKNITPLESSFGGSSDLLDDLDDEDDAAIRRYHVDDSRYYHHEFSDAVSPMSNHLHHQMHNSHSRLSTTTAASNAALYDNAGALNETSKIPRWVPSFSTSRRAGFNPIQYDENSSPANTNIVADCLGNNSLIKKLWQDILELRTSARQRRVARMLNTPSESSWRHQIISCTMTWCCDATDRGILLVAVLLSLWILIGVAYYAKSATWWLMGILLFGIRVTARRTAETLINYHRRRHRRQRANNSSHFRPVDHGSLELGLSSSSSPPMSSPQQAQQQQPPNSAASTSSPLSPHKSVRPGNSGRDSADSKRSDGTTTTAGTGSTAGTHQFDPPPRSLSPPRSGNGEPGQYTRNSMTRTNLSPVEII